MSASKTHEKRRSALADTLRDQLDALPYGPGSKCGLCGDTVIGQRHRVIDAIAGRIRAGEPWQSVVNDWLGYDADEAAWSNDQVHIAADMAVYALAVSVDE